MIYHIKALTVVIRTTLLEKQQRFWAKSNFEITHCIPHQCNIYKNSKPVHPALAVPLVILYRDTKILVQLVFSTVFTLIVDCTCFPGFRLDQLLAERAKSFAFRKKVYIFLFMWSEFSVLPAQQPVNLC